MRYILKQISSIYRISPLFLKKIINNFFSYFFFSFYKFVKISIYYLNYRVFLSLFDLSSYKYIADNGPKDKYHLSLIKKLSKNFDIFFDIGGNYGFYSLSNINNFKKIIYIEPSNSFLFFKKTIIHNNLQDKIKAYNVKIGFFNKKNVFYQNFSSNSSGIKKKTSKVTYVREVCFNSFLNKLKNNLKITIKIDVVGNEIPILLSIKNLRKYKNICIFIDIYKTDNLFKSKNLINNHINKYFSNQFHFFRIHNRKKILLSKKTFIKSIYDFDNVKNREFLNNQFLILK